MSEQGPFYSESGSSPPILDDPRLPQRIREKVGVDPNTGCWVWTACRNQAGYGEVRLDGRMRKAHRAAYELLVGPIPDGLVCDHLCSNPACVRPDHLQLVTVRENTRRGWARVRAGHAPSTSKTNRRGPAMRARDRRRRERLAAEKRCQGCGSPELETKRHCASCAAAVRERTNRRKAELIAAGLCRKGCGRPVAAGSKSHCEPCLAKQRERDRRHWRARRREKAAA